MRLLRPDPSARATTAAWAALVLCAVGCATSTSTALGPSSTGTGAAGTGGAGTGGAGTGAGPAVIPCSTHQPCAAGTTCVNGACTAGCNTDADCMSGQYCALTNGQICVDVTNTACPATPCAPTQVCVEGLCGTIPTGNPCGQGLFGGDGCAMNELCLTDVVVDGTLQTMPTCYTLPPCDMGHPCTPGGMGALCSQGVIMNNMSKSPLCIPGGCETDADCPAKWKCIPGPAMGLYGQIGQCTNGEKGEPCDATSDCKAGLMCYVPIMSQLGTCK
jgi:hypothetical protein